MTEPHPHRLPRTVVPRHYDLRLVPDLAGASFVGTVDVAVEVAEPVTEVVLNALELAIDEAWVEADGARRDVAVALDADHGRATLALDGGPLAAGPATVHLAFRGTLNDKLRGFYRSTFVDEDDVERVIATTQFEATDARRAFPCWDEPDLKATFSVTLDVAEDLFAVSNAAEVGREPIGDGRHRVRFAESMLMSTYLVAFVVGPLEATDPVDVDGVPLRIVHRAGQAELTAFALESGAFALRHFTEYFGVPYPADKLDLVAVPDFAFGAMENVGCVIFRDALLVVDPARSTQAELQRVADVIHHEVAHMWFGDLVTMEWWEGIWLNEAFATFMEMRCTDAFRPGWDRWTDFGISRTAAYDTDALTTTRPIEFEVVSPADAEGMFDVLTYEKGAAVVRMLEQYLGEDRFRAGIRLYIDRHRHGNTRTTDLWDAIEEATGEPVRRIMDSWIYQGGHPEVSVTTEPAGTGTTLRLAQQRFLYDTGEGPEVDTTRWSIPVLVRWAPVDADPTDVRLERVLIEDRTAEVTLPAEPAWVLANSGGSGFFRVRYDPAGLVAASRAPDITAVERYGLIDDAWAALLAGAIGIGEVLDLVRGYADETDLSVWQRVVAVIAALDRLVTDDVRPHLQTWVRGFCGPALRRVGLDATPGEPPRTAALRGSLVTALGTTGADPDTRRRAEGLLDRAHAGDDVDADLFDAALRVLAAEGGAERFTSFRHHAATGVTPQERLRYLGVLADFPGDAEAAAFRAMWLTDDVRTQDAPFVVRRSIANRAQAGASWDHLARHWDETLARLPSNSIARLLEGIRTITDPQLAHAVESFLAEHPVPQGDKPIAQHRERMRAGVALRERVAGDLASALKDGRP